MKLISTYVHGVLDYIVGVVLIFAPEIFGLVEVAGVSEALPRLCGFIILIMAVSTNYEVGIFRLISMRTHIVADYLLGGVLALSPWLFGFSNLPARYWLPHLIVGAAIVLVAAVTEPVPAPQPQAPRRAPGYR
ncbi:MAG: SPW repeat protein [Deltaproteobacteria bacterium]|nr:SPW repeat protein [Deltaproteobacteria bacterium]